MALPDLLKKAVLRPDYALSRGWHRALGLAEDVLIQYFRKAPDEITNQKEIRVLGLRRTGNHAIINWIEKQAGDAVHLNNLRVDENPYKYIYQAFSGKGHQLDRWMAQETSRYPQYRGEEGKLLLQREAKGMIQPKNVLITSYEDYPIPKVASKRAERTHDYYLGKSRQRFDVLILRDPFNLAASRLQKGFTTVKSLSQTVADMWVDYAKEYLGETQYLRNIKVVINYNQWVLDKRYRQAVAHQLGLEFSDAGLQEVPLFAGGSSFDRTIFSGSAAEMKLFQRWQYYTENKCYLEMVRNEELFYYSEKIFGSMQGTEIFRPSAGC
jgi:hypothetical protein